MVEGTGKVFKHGWHKGRLKSPLWDQESYEIGTRSLCITERKVVILCFEDTKAKKKKKKLHFSILQLGGFFICLFGWLIGFFGICSFVFF